MQYQKPATRAGFIVSSVLVWRVLVPAACNAWQIVGTNYPLLYPLRDCLQKAGDCVAWCDAFVWIGRIAG